MKDIISLVRRQIVSLARPQRYDGVMKLSAHCGRPSHWSLSQSKGRGRRVLRWMAIAEIALGHASLLVCAPAIADSAATQPQPPAETRTLARKLLAELIA